MVEDGDRVAAAQKMMGTDMFIRKPSLPVFFPAADDLVDLRRQTVSFHRHA
jgi:hypothetical protein